MGAMRPVDPYKLLQVDPEADAEIIQVAYRKLAQRYHPDVAQGPEDARRMADLNAARDLLLDPVARAAHDRTRTSPGASGPTGSSVGAATTGSPAARGEVRPAPRDVAGEGAAGPPPGSPSGSVLAFGRYAGWSLGDIARRDLEYVEWLERMPIGRPHRDEIDAILRHAGRRGGATSPEEPRGLFRRR
jgi:curved DNA-binding protein CbpA